MSDETKHVFVGLVGVHSPTLWFLIFLNIIFAITSILGNVIILAALKKQSSLHPPSKILLSFLAITDLCAGLISLPIFITLLMASQYKIEDIVTFTTELTSYISTALCLSSLFTLAAISVDRFSRSVPGHQIQTSGHLTENCNYRGLFLDCHRRLHYHGELD